jgi:hypothetical protein
MIGAEQITQLSHLHHYRNEEQSLTFLGSDDEGLRGSVHQSAVSIYQVSHVLCYS